MFLCYVYYITICIYIFYTYIFTATIEVYTYIYTIEWYFVITLCNYIAFYKARQLLKVAAAVAANHGSSCYKSRHWLPYKSRQRLLYKSRHWLPHHGSGCYKSRQRLLYKSRQWLLQLTAAVATNHGSGCYKSRQRLLQSQLVDKIMAAAATNHGSGCYKSRLLAEIMLAEIGLLVRVVVVRVWFGVVSGCQIQITAFHAKSR